MDNCFTGSLRVVRREVGLIPGALCQCDLVQQTQGGGYFVGWVYAISNEKGVKLYHDRTYDSGMILIRDRKPKDIQKGLGINLAVRNRAVRAARVLAKEKGLEFVV